MKEVDMKYCVFCDHFGVDVDEDPCKECIQSLFDIHDKPHYQEKKRKDKRVWLLREKGGE